MRLVTIVPGKGHNAGKAVFEDLDFKINPPKMKGEGEIEERQPADDFGDWHTATAGTKTFIKVESGVWVVEVAGGGVREFGRGSLVLSDDSEVTAENGHRSKAKGPEPIVLLKVTVKK